MDEQRAFYDKLVVMEAALRDRPKDSDPRLEHNTPKSLSSDYLPFLSRGAGS